MKELLSSDKENEQSIVHKKLDYSYLKNKITDQDILSAMKQDQSYALMRYRELVLARKRREKLRPREPEVYHHDIFKK